MRLEHAVEKVARGGAPGVEHGLAVESSQGVFTATQAVVTVPIGVLQSNGVTFEPPLPDVVADAIPGFRMNAFAKIFLRFPSGSWTKACMRSAA